VKFLCETAVAFSFNDDDTFFPCYVRVSGIKFGQKTWRQYHPYTARVSAVNQIRLSSLTFFVLEFVLVISYLQISFQNYLLIN